MRRYGHIAPSPGKSRPYVLHVDLGLAGCRQVHPVAAAASCAPRTGRGDPIHSPRCEHEDATACGSPRPVDIELYPIARSGMRDEDCALLAVMLDVSDAVASWREGGNDRVYPARAHIKAHFCSSESLADRRRAQGRGPASSVGSVCAPDPSNRP